MGLTQVVVKVGNGKKAIDVNLLVDSGAVYTLLPQKVWKSLGLKPIRKMNFTLADGTIIKREISETRIEFKGLYATTPVILGKGRDESLLGTLTLEALGLVLNPFNRELRPMKMMLATTVYNTPHS